MRGVSPVVRVSCCTDSGKTPETVRKTCPRLLPVEVGPTAWRWTQAGANRSRPLDGAIAPRRPPRELAGFRETGLDYVRVRGSSWELGARAGCRLLPRFWRRFHRPIGGAFNVLPEKLGELGVANTPQRSRSAQKDEHIQRCSDINILTKDTNTTRRSA